MGKFQAGVRQERDGGGHHHHHDHGAEGHHHHDSAGLNIITGTAHVIIMTYKDKQMSSF